MAISTRTRFEVFKRDGFRCRYCGATAAENELHVDHVHPVAEGGGDEPGNLVTACRDCNLGKSDVPLESVRLDAAARLADIERKRRREDNTIRVYADGDAVYLPRNLSAQRYPRLKRRGKKGTHHFSALLDRVLAERLPPGVNEIEWFTCGYRVILHRGAPPPEAS